MKRGQRPDGGAQRQAHPAAALCEAGDEIYCRHPRLGPISARILACGRDGFTGEGEGGRRLRLPWDSYLGHRARVLQRYEVVDEGADGAILADERGRRRYVASNLGREEGREGAKEQPAEQEDPVLGGLDRLHKALDVPTVQIHKPAPWGISEAQKRAGNYPKAHVRWNGLEIAIENPRGSVRTGVDPGGRPWVSSMPHDYGYILGTEGVDGDHFDVLLGPAPDWSDTVWVATTNKPPAFDRGDEQKALIGFPTEAAAREAFHAMYDNPLFLRELRAMTADEFKAKVLATARKPALIKSMGIRRRGAEEKIMSIKSIDLPSSARFLFLKATGAAIANRPGLALQERPDRRGGQVHRWVRTAQDQPAGDGQGKGQPPAAGQKPAAAQKPERPTMKMGEVVSFRQGNVEGQGRIVAAGADGVTLEDDEGREHRVLHENLVGPVKEDPAGQGLGSQESPEAAGALVAKRGESAGGGAENSRSTLVLKAPLFSSGEVKDLPRTASQPVKTEAELYTKGTEALDQLTEWLDRQKGIISRLGFRTLTKGFDEVDLNDKGGLLAIAPLKGKARAEEKVDADYGGDWSQLRDVVRCSIAVDQLDQVRTALDALRKGGMKLAQKPKDRFAKPTNVGYRDVLLNVVLPNGIIGEVQLHVKSMLQAKAVAHAHYETMRTLDAKPREQWSAEDEQTWQDAFDQSSDIYGAAWTKAAGEEGKGSELTKALGGEWEFFEHDGAFFRRPAGRPGGVTHVLAAEKGWKDYRGNRTDPVLWGDKVADPSRGGGAGTFAKSIGAPMLLLLKAHISAPGQGDLFGAKVDVAGHVRGGHFVAPYQATRHKRTEEGKSTPAGTQPSAQERRGGEIVDQLRPHIQAGRLDGDDHALVAELDRILPTIPATSETARRIAEARKEAIDVMMREPVARVDESNRSFLREGLANRDRDGGQPQPTEGKEDPEAELRKLWTEQGVSKERQDQILAEINAKASPGAMVGPFAMGGGEARYFYVVAHHIGKHHLVAGPYHSHEEAKGMVDQVRDYAITHDRGDIAEWADWGTAGSVKPLRTPLGENWKPRKA